MIVRDVRMRARRKVVVAVMMISSWSYVHRCSCSLHVSLDVVWGVMCDGALQVASC